MYIYYIEVIKLNKPEIYKPFPKWATRFFIRFAVCIVIFSLAFYMKGHFPLQIKQAHSYLRDDSSQGILQTKAREFILKYSPMLE